jgi:hypothetical protein
VTHVRDGSDAQPGKSPVTPSDEGKPLRDSRKAAGEFGICGLMGAGRSGHRGARHRGLTGGRLYWIVSCWSRIGTDGMAMWIGRQDVKLDRSEAIRRLVELGLKAMGK